MRALRLESIDLLRGVAMILMALDHTRDFLGVPGISPTDLSRASAGLFFARWITHICAPVFFLLTGTAACLALRHKSKSELSRFLFTRGVWLIFLDVVVVRCFAMQFNFDYHVTMLVVLWALGWEMIVLSLLVHLPKPVVTVFGVVMIVGHNLFDGLQPSRLGWFGPAWNVLHVPGTIFSSNGHVVFVAYPLIPWVAVTAVGYGLGQVFDWPRERRRVFLLLLGIRITAAFAILRGMNVYGDPARWTSQKSVAFTMLSYLNTTKYPPSLFFLLMTLGPAMLLLWAFDRETPRCLRPVLIFGRVPLFYFVLHLALIHLLAVLVCYARYGQVHWMFESPTLGQYPFTPPPGWGFSLPVVYFAWAVVVIALYPLCAWFSALKQRRTDPWLSYL